MSQPAFAPNRRPGRFPVFSGWVCLVMMFLAVPPGLRAQDNEFRGLWVDAWGSDLYTAAGISAIVADIRAGNMNAVIPQIRRRGDSLYNSLLEPKVTNIDPAFDPLADLISKAHNTATGRRIEVHAWLVTYHAWTTSSTYPTPPQPNHPVNLHPDWLLQDVNGNTLIDGQYTLDPGHPDVQRHTFDVCMDILTRYDIDGLNFDYIRYSSLNEGYNPVTVARFNKRFNRTGKPSPTDPVWMQFRRDQITGLLRKVYLYAAALKPHVKISCDTITWTPAPATAAGWYSSAAWGTVLQDWRGWMQEGIMDLNIPMNYFRQSVPSHALAYTNWSNFAKDHRFNRHVVIGPGIYLNGIQQSIQQIRQTRQPTSAGNRADGAVGYSYRVTNTNGVSRAAFLQALVAPGSYDPGPAVFAQPVDTPVMPWKTQPTTGHIKGFVISDTGQPLDGATVTINGAANQGRVNDATGFYGFVDLAPGDYTVTASFPGYTSKSRPFTVKAGQVTTLDVVLPVVRPRFSDIELLDSGEVRLQASGPPGQYAIDWSTDTTNWLLLTNLDSSSAGFQHLDRAGGGSRRFYRLRHIQ